MNHESRPSASRGLLPVALVIGAGVAAGLLLRRTVRQKRRMSLTNKVVLITGGSRGLGLELARQFAAAGAKVAICARDAAELADAEADLRRRGTRDVLAAVCDVTDAPQVADFVDQVRAAFGRVDILVNNAGIVTVAPFEAHDDADFAKSFATHVNAPLSFIRAVLPEMKARRSGRIVNVASIGGKQPVPHMSAYVASKHALVGLSETLRGELQQHGVYVTLVCPGVIRTGSPVHGVYKGDPKAEYAWFAGADNLRLLAIAPEDLARQIIDATVHGDAELVAPANAWLSTLAFNAASGIGTEVLGLLARLFPRDAGVRRPVSGLEADVGQLPGMLQAEQLRNAAKFNQNH